MDFQYVFCKKEDWDRLFLPNLDYEVWYYENFVKIQTVGSLEKQAFPFFSFSGTVGDEILIIEMFDGDRFGKFIMSVEMKMTDDIELVKFFGMNDGYVKNLLYSENAHTCPISYKTTRNFEQEKSFDELFKQEVNEDDWK